MARCCERKRHDDFRKQRCEAVVKNSGELLMTLWNERRPECAHLLTGATKGWKIASARAPTRLHRCGVRDKWLHTGPSRLLPCWRAAGNSSQKDPLKLPILVVSSENCAPLGLRQKWIMTKRDAPAECDVTILQRALLQERFERCCGGKPNSS